MSDSSYDQAIREHYRSVAEADGLSATSTMADLRVRQLETEAILQFVRGAEAAAIRERGRAVVADLGCGNGYTLERLLEAEVAAQLVGVEMTPEMLDLARRRLSGTRILVRPGDVRSPEIAATGEFDGIYCQRVLINILDEADQRAALANVVRTVRPGGWLLFIEGMQGALERLNGARAEFDLPPLPPAHHNLYLPADFFEIDELEPLGSDVYAVGPQHLSTHYYVSRVLHPLVLGERPFRRNSEFVRFFSRALPPGIGDFAQIEVRAFRRTGETGRAA